VIKFQTSLGSFTIELAEEDAPITCANFLKYVDEGFYAGTTFHRVIPGFMIQGGGMTADMKQKKTNPPIQNEAKNGLKNRRGSLSMARTDDVNSATSQFFVNVADNAFLDHRPGSYGYAVFAHVVAGMDVVDKIVAVKTGRKGPHDDVPLEAVVIESVSRVEG
jgi:peptidyl-prolyl cis-trans isomerase A (cyclophilin A)/peptidyl-prolyl cis-trans isomerase B (cyclophilin B)